MAFCNIDYLVKSLPKQDTFRLMRILFTLTPPFDPHAGGVQRTTYKLGKYFSEQGLQVAYFSMANTGHVSVEFGELFYSKEPGLTSNKNNLTELRHCLRKWHPDVVINQMPYEAELRYTLFISKNKYNYFLIGCLRNSLFSVINNPDLYAKNIIPFGLHRFLKNNFGRFILLNLHRYFHRRDLKQIVDQHDYFVLLTPPNLREYQYFIGNYKQKKIIIIPNSIPEVNGKINKREKIILYVGRLDITQKRADLLIPIWKQILGKLPDWQFIIIGDGFYFENLKKQIDKEKIAGINLLGNKNPYQYYKNASIFLMPSAYEGFPNTILEAQSNGLPVLAFDSYPALRWIVNDGKDALLSPPFYIRHMADNAIELISNQKRLINMQKAAIENAKRFTIDKIGRQWLYLFDKIRYMS